jgi:putative ABC transport system permease protein
MWSFLPRLAMRSLLRNRRRTALTFFAIMAGMVGVIVFGGFVSNTFWELREETILAGLGHLQVYREGYTKNAVAEPERYRISDFERVEREIESMPGVQVVGARLTLSGLISNGERTLPCIATGGIPERETKLTSRQRIIAGEPLTSNEQVGAVIGSELSRALQAKVGDTVTLLTTTATGMLNASDVEVVGIARMATKEYDRVLIRIPLSLAQKLLNATAVERVVVQLQRTEDTVSVSAALQRHFAARGLPLEIKRWDELSDFYKAVQRMYGGLFDVIKGIIAAMFLFGIANTMTMTVSERVREIGTLRAIGTKKTGIIALFLCEGFLLGALGGVFGLGAGILAAELINASGGFHIPPPPGFNLGYDALIFLEPGVLFYAFVSTIVVATASSLYPAWRAANLTIVEALGHT